MSSEWEIEQDVIATKESYILDCGYKIGEIRAPLLGWYALPPGQTHLIDPGPHPMGRKITWDFFRRDSNSLLMFTKQFFRRCHCMMRLEI